MGKKICVICGEEGYSYLPFCKKHLDEKNEGKIVKCECGTWHYADKPCPNCKEKSILATPKNLNDKSLESTTSELTCIICGEPSNGKHLCKSCFYKYKSKDIFLKVKKCEFPCGEPISEFYDGSYDCNDGHVVKSMAEQQIDNYLFRNGIAHGYELPLDVGTEKPLRPDFCLKNYLGDEKDIDEKNDVYIEYFGKKGDPDYDKTTAYKMGYYREQGITLICLYPKTDSNNIEYALQTKLKKEKIKKGIIHYSQD